MEPLGRNASTRRRRARALFAALATLTAAATIDAARSTEVKGSHAASPKATDGVVQVVEYRNPSLGHYFITADTAEIAALDGGALGGAWVRTGQTFSAWSIAGAPEGAGAVCRFFGTDQYRGDGTRIGPNSHFYTADTAECDYVKTAWQSIAANGTSYPAWTFESNAFAVRRPVNEICPTDTQPIHRAYNNGAGGDPNHRYATRLETLQNMGSGWTIEGVVMCGNGFKPPGTLAKSGSCLIPVPGFSGQYVSSADASLRQQVVVTGTAAAPVETTRLTTSVGTLTTTRDYEVYPGTDLTLVGTSHVREEFAGANFTLINDLDGDGYVLSLPMEEGDVQTGLREVIGTQTFSLPGYTCQGSIQGALRWQFEFVGLEQVTVPAGTFNACRFMYGRKSILQAVCGQVTGGGEAADPVILWAVEGLGIVKSSNPNDGSTVELAGY